MGEVVATHLGAGALDPNAVVAQVNDDRAGAVVTFTGAVRNHDQGKQVSFIDYEAHPEAAQVLHEIAVEAATRPGVHQVALAHRIGRVHVGEVVMVAVVTASRRGEAFETTTWLVDTVKERLPVWKRQAFPDGSAAWTGA